MLKMYRSFVFVILCVSIQNLEASGVCIEDSFDIKARMDRLICHWDGCSMRIISEHTPKLPLPEGFNNTDDYRIKCLYGIQHMLNATSTGPRNPWYMYGPLQETFLPLPIINDSDWSFLAPMTVYELNINYTQDKKWKTWYYGTKLTFKTCFIKPSYTQSHILEIKEESDGVLSISWDEPNHFGAPHVCYYEVTVTETTHPNKNVVYHTNGLTIKDVNNAPYVSKNITFQAINDYYSFDGKECFIDPPSGCQKGIARVSVHYNPTTTPKPINMAYSIYNFELINFTSVVILANIFHFRQRL